MSRKAKITIKIPQGVEVKFDQKALHVKGPKGQLSQPLTHGVVAEIEDGSLKIIAGPQAKNDVSQFLGLYWTLASNMVQGVKEGFEKSLEMIGVGYRSSVQGSLLDLQAGFSHPTKLPIPEGLTVQVEKNTLIKVQGADKQLVGQFCADIRGVRPPEPYKGKGIRYVGEYVRRKAGKSGKK